MSRVKVRNLLIGYEKPKICVPTTGTDDAAILQQVRQVTDTPADMIEIRIDYFCNYRETDSVCRLMEQVRKEAGNLPVLFTFRSEKEGGRGSFSFEEYQKLLVSTAQSKMADLIDVELFCADEPALCKLSNSIHAEGATILMSSHDFHKTPSEEEMTSRLIRMQRLHADIVKLAVMPQSEEDVLRLLSVSLKWKNTEAVPPAVTMAMGQLGIISRISGAVFGSTVTFACDGEASAPGQLPVQTMSELLQSLS